MQFRDKKGYLYPPQAYWHGAQPARRMVDLSNELFLYSGTNIQFVLKEYRVNTTKYPYLRYRNVAEYQACAAQQEKCTCVLAAKHNVDSSRCVVGHTCGWQHVPVSYLSVTYQLPVSYLSFTYRSQVSIQVHLSLIARLPSASNATC
jgi:hypothetical protein